jgi:hypothetical protein
VFAPTSQACVMSATKPCSRPSCARALNCVQRKLSLATLSRYSATKRGQLRRAARLLNQLRLSSRANGCSPSDFSKAAARSSTISFTCAGGRDKLH